MRNANFSYGIRALAGVYMLYLAYQLVGGHISGESAGIQFLIFGILFGVIGLACVATGARYFLTGKLDKWDSRGSQDSAGADCAGGDLEDQDSAAEDLAGGDFDEQDSHAEETQEEEEK